jgi:guanylate kinase
MSDNSEMAKEYDFSGAQRGKFYRPDAQVQIPVYLEPESLAFVQEIAQRRGTDISEVVNGLLKADRELLNQAQ